MLGPLIAGLLMAMIFSLPGALPDDIAGAQGTPPAGSRPDAVPDRAITRPVDTRGIDPVLDAVDVDDTAAIRRADDALVRAAAAQNEATLRWIEAEKVRSELASKAGRAGEIAAQAQTANDEAVAVLQEKELRLTERKQIEAGLRATLARRQDELRELVAKLYATAPEDRYAVLGSLDDVTAADQRDALRDRGSALQVDRVDAARRPWSKAHEARLVTQRQVARARFVVTTSRAEAIRAADERDRFGELVAAADGKVQTAVTGLTAASEASRGVLVDRRTARLESTVTDLDLPLVALDSYWRASALAPCRVPWWVIAGVGRVESGHGSARGSSLTAEGDTKVHILGIPLDGRPGVAAIPDSDGGRLDDDTTWDRAVGPMQFIPGTWNRWAADGNADEKTDPHNIYDAAGAAARYLCFTRGDLETEAQIRDALLAYNRSVAYGTEVLAKGERYRDALDLPDVPGDASE